MRPTGLEVDIGAFVEREHVHDFYPLPPVLLDALYQVLPFRSVTNRTKKGNHLVITNGKYVYDIGWGNQLPEGRGEQRPWPAPTRLLWSAPQAGSTGQWQWPAGSLHRWPVEGSKWLLDLWPAHAGWNLACSSALDHCDRLGLEDALACGAGHNTHTC